MIDLTVVGGGPAGLMTALHAARAGFETVLLEQRSAPIDKACGEGLMPSALSSLQQVGVDPPGHLLRGITYVQGATAVSADFPATPGRGVRRTELHRALHEAALAAGVKVLDRRAELPVQDEGSVRTSGVTSRFLVAADGLHSPIRRQLDAGAHRSRAGRRWGQRVHLAVPPWSNHVEVHWGPHHEAYVTPVAPDQVGVAILGGRGQWAHQLEAFPDLAGRLREAEHCGPVRAAGPLRQPVRRRVHGRILLVGDAAGYLDALTGEGLALAFSCAGALVARLVANEPQAYEADWRRISRRSRLITSSLLWATQHALLRGRVVPVAAALPRLFETAVAQLA
jgi:flavin-dependent dehydrogenase